MLVRARLDPGLSYLDGGLPVGRPDGSRDRRDACRGRRGRRSRRRGPRQVVAESRDPRDDGDEPCDAGFANPGSTIDRARLRALGHASTLSQAALPARIRFSICRRYAPAL